MSKCEEITIVIDPDTFDMCNAHVEVALVGFAGRPDKHPRFDAGQHQRLEARCRHSITLVRTWNTPRR